MAYDCRFQATIKDHIPLEYYRFMTAEKKPKVEIPAPRAMFVKKCMAPALSRKIAQTPSSMLMERAKRNGLRHSIFNAQRDVYTGEWKDDAKEGHGAYKSRTGRILYEGEWKNGKADGFGVLCHQGDHKRYNIYFEGFFKGGKPQESWRYKKVSPTNTSVFDVHFKFRYLLSFDPGTHLEQREELFYTAQGTGYHFYKDGSYYKGDWRNGIRSGFGKMWYADGTYYEGEFYDDQRHGQGLFVFHNGNRYVGKWARNEKHGLGAYYFMDKGQIQFGHWNRDSCINSWIVDMKYRQSVEHPTEFSIPTKAPIVKQHKRYVKEKLEKSNTRDAGTQTDD